MAALKIVGVTNCPAGIAHTYMVAESIETHAKAQGYEVHVETQGASGIENQLTAQQIADADYVILALGKGMSDEDKARFDGKQVIELPVSEALKEMDTVFANLHDEAHLFTASKVKLGNEKTTDGIMSHLMAGVSAALPFVIGGGLLMAIGNMLVQFGAADIAPKAGQMASLAWILNTIGGLGFTMMIPIMGAYIAYSIGDKPALAPAFLATYLANSPDLLGTQGGAGFLGAVVIGLAVGYFVREFKKVKLGKTFQSTLGFLIIPFVTLLIFGLGTYYLLGPAMAAVMAALLSFLQSIPPSMKILGGFLVGAMLAFDMGGPINKTAWFFGFSLLSSHVYTWYGIAGIVTLLPPMAAAIATWVRPRLFTKQERESSWSAMLVGMTVATEPAIPYALAAPVPMISANTLAGGITGAISMAFGIERLAPGLGIFDPIIGLSRPAIPYYFTLAIGLALNVLFIVVFKTAWLKRQERKSGVASLKEQSSSVITNDVPDVSAPGAVTTAKTVTPNTK